MRTLTRKGYGRIYCEAERQIQIVADTIRAMDAFEFEYLPNDFIATFAAYPAVVYIGKFDALDVDALTAICWKNGIHIWVYDSGNEAYPKAAELQPEGE